MSTLSLDRANRLRSEAKRLIAPYRDRALPPDVGAKVTTLMDEVSDILGREQYERRTLGALDGLAEAARADRPSAVDERLGWLDARDWRVKAGWLCAPDATGGHTPLWPAASLAAPASAEQKAVRAAATVAYRNAFARWLSLSVKHLDPSMALRLLDGQEQKALSEGSDSAGGFLVPADTTGGIMARLGQRSVFRRLARVRPTARDTLRQRLFLEHTTSGSVYASDFVGSWVGETATLSETTVRFGVLDVAIRKARAFTKVSRDLADDEPEALSWLVTNAGENLALVEDRAFIAGLGTALQPLGILNAGVSTVDVEGSTANTISNTTGATGSAPKVQQLIAALPSQYQDRAAWICRANIEGKVRGLVDAQGRFHWPYGEPRSPSGDRQLLGFPIHANEAVEDEGADGRKVLVLGDLDGYLIATRALLSVQILRERHAETDELGLVVTDRVGGAVWNPDAFRIGIV